MPQTLSPRLHCTVTLAANDLATVKYAGAERGGLILLNYRPGDVWASIDPQHLAAVGDPNCFLLTKGITLVLGGIGRTTNLTLMSSQASTQVSIAFSNR